MSSPISKVKAFINSINYSWLDLLLTTTFFAIIYIFSEWVFIITKPSFLDTVQFTTKARILIFTLAGLVLISLFIIFMFFMISSLTKKSGGKKLLRILGSLFATFIITSTALLLIDNFTNTVFDFGIGDTKTPGRIIYLVSFLGLFSLVFVKFNQNLSDLTPTKRIEKSKTWVVLGLVTITILALIFTYRPNLYSGTAVSNLRGSEFGKLPNVILLTSDGVNASHMSVYGYELKTTPFMDELVGTSLIAENAFSNSNGTDGSTISIFSGKLPSETRVLYAQDILKGKDAYQHLPGILKKYGFYNAQFSHGIHGDVFRHNLLEGFDQANGRITLTSPLIRFINRWLQTDQAYFIYEIANRLSDRLLHVFFVKPMETNRALLEGEKTEYNDIQKINNLMEVIEDKDQPVFGHLHFMVTHGPTYEVLNPYYSKDLNSDEQEPWNTPFYDDSIRQFDWYIREIIKKLGAIGEYNKTIIIIGTDHGQQWSTNVKVPLIFHFPEGQYTGKVTVNAQNLDIAPTILDFLNISSPEWMTGRSLIQADLVDDPILSFGVGDVSLGDDQLTLKPEFLQPPFYQFGVMNLVSCNYWYEINLRELKMTTGEIEDHQNACTSSPITGQEAFMIMKNHLEDTGFDVSGLEKISIPEND